MLDLNQIHHGDCLDLMQHIPDGSVQCLITSPPYFNAKDYDGFTLWPTYEAYLETVAQWVAEMVRAMEPGRMVCINVSPVIVPRIGRNARSQRHNLPGDWHGILSQAGLWFCENITWAKPEGAAINRNQRFSLDRHPMQWRGNPVTESILVYQKPTKQLNDVIIKKYGGAGRIQGEFDRSDLWHINPNTNSAHPAPFPVELPLRLLKYYTWAGDAVLDPFMGSGTTAVAALTTGRNFIGIEQEEKYVNIGRARVAALQTTPAQQTLPL